MCTKWDSIFRPRLAALIYSLTFSLVQQPLTRRAQTYTMASSSSQPSIPPFIGYVETTLNALRLVHAARQGVIPRITRRLNDTERRTMIRSGAVFVFSVEESGIKRWTGTFSTMLTLVALTAANQTGCSGRLPASSATFWSVIPYSFPFSSNLSPS